MNSIWDVSYLVNSLQFILGHFDHCNTKKFSKKVKKFRGLWPNLEVWTFFNSNTNGIDGFLSISSFQTCCSSLWINNWNVTGSIRNSTLETGVLRGWLPLRGEEFCSYGWRKKSWSCVSHTLRNRQMFTKSLLDIMWSWRLKMHTILGLLAMIKCSICSCQINIWHEAHGDSWY